MDDIEYPSVPMVVDLRKNSYGKSMTIPTFEVHIPRDSDVEGTSRGQDDSSDDNDDVYAAYEQGYDYDQYGDSNSHHGNFHVTQEQWESQMANQAEILRRMEQMQLAQTAFFDEARQDIYQLHGHVRQNTDAIAALGTRFDAMDQRWPVPPPEYGPPYFDHMQQRWVFPPPPPSGDDMQD
jgi:hypothetical protein